MGLGLALVRRFADLLGHRITVLSRPGRGSRFAVEMPRVTDLRSPLPHEYRSPASSIGSFDSALYGATVAVVDDDVAAVDAMRTLFATWGANVAGGHDAASTLASLGELERYPDLIVADLRLDRDASGLDAVATLRHELGVRVPALVVSGDMSASAAHSVRAAGLALLPKPVLPSALVAAATALIASTR
jgi:CheY-like chemotaxis protein